MANKRLNAKDVDRLLADYRSERRRLNYQLDLVRKAIVDLKAVRGERSSEEPEDRPKRGPGRPRKDPNAPVAPKKRAGRRKKRVVENGGYRLSDWDNMIIAAINKAGRLLTKEELYKASLTWAKKNEPEMSEEDVMAKLSRVLQKLSGKRGMLGTHRTGLMRGYHYGVKEWFFASSGALRKQHYDKLVINKG
ncbi:MAG: hypothetical protein KF905_07165 [Flavobacteriales bacterium]|nr:hypothetical protein [Flavobacteriales bacterium]